MHPERRYQMLKSSAVLLQKWDTKVLFTNVRKTFIKNTPNLPTIPALTSTVLIISRSIVKIYNGPTTKIQRLGQSDFSPIIYSIPLQKGQLYTVLLTS